jgi:hypothetical protein
MEAILRAQRAAAAIQCYESRNRAVVNLSINSAGGVYPEHLVSSFPIRLRLEKESWCARSKDIDIEMVKHRVRP